MSFEAFRAISRRFKSLGYKITSKRFGRLIVAVRGIVGHVIVIAQCILYKMMMNNVWSIIQYAMLRTEVVLVRLYWCGFKQPPVLDMIRWDGTGSDLK